MKYTKGFVGIGVIIAVIGALVVGGGAIYYATKTKAPSTENIGANNYQPVEQNYTPPITNTNQQTPPPSSNPPSQQQVGCNSNSPSTIKVLSPNGGEVYQAGQQITVKWKSCNVTPNSIGIILIKHNPAVPYTQSEGQGDYAGFNLGNYSTADDGTEQIILPPSSNTNLVSGQHYFIAVTGLGDNTHIGSGYAPRDYSDSLFTITSSQSNNNVSNQPAYLIKAYSQNSKNYIDVDYIQILSGMASLQAQVADGSCPNVNDCYDYPNGYKQNTNPLVRTFEVSSNVVITSSWDPYPDTNQITFQQFQNSQSWYPIPTNPPFQPAKGPYITIDVQNNIVTKITRPYQE